MAHIVETMAYAGEVPWHGLGKKVLPDLTPDQMLVEAGLDWEVETHPLTYRYNGDNHASGEQALIRSSDGKYLSTISDDWNPVQNHTAFEFFNDFVMAGDMEMNTAGSLKDGKMVWALAKVKDTFEVMKGDTVESYLLFSNPHEYGKCIDIRFTPIRVVCNNTLTLAVNTASDRVVRKNHRAPFDADSVKDMLGIAHKKMEIYKETAQFLSSKRFHPADINSYFGQVFPSMSKKYADAVLDDSTLSRPAKEAKYFLDEQPGAEYGEGSFWQLFNAATYYIDHKAGNSDDTRLTSAWYGANSQKKIKALNKAVEMAEAA
jgi:phage/plasmid-like protein (TIGR03299 family)